MKRVALAKVSASRVIRELSSITRVLEWENTVNVRNPDVTATLSAACNKSRRDKLAIHMIGKDPPPHSMQHTRNKINQYREYRIGAL